MFRHRIGKMIKEAEIKALLEIFMPLAADDADGYW